MCKGEKEGREEEEERNGKKKGRNKEVECEVDSKICGGILQRWRGKELQKNSPSQGTELREHRVNSGASSYITQNAGS